MLYILHKYLQTTNMGLLNIQVAQQSVTKIIASPFINLTIPKTGAKHEILFNKPASVILYFIKYSAHFFTLKKMLKYSLHTIHGRYLRKGLRWLL